MNQIPDDWTLATRIAAQMVATATADYRKRNIKFFTLTDARTPEPPPFPALPQRKNIYGVTFSHPVGAERWVRTALLAGFTVFYDWGTGRRLEHGAYSDNNNDDNKGE